MIIGINLSDGWFQKSKSGWNPRQGIKQSIKNFEYIWVVYNEISIQCGQYPFISKSKIRGQLFYSISFQTRQLHCLIEIYNIFYTKNSIKSISQELLDYFDYIVQAHWIMGDGSKNKKGLILCTNRFTLKENR